MMGFPMSNASLPLSPSQRLLDEAEAGLQAAMGDRQLETRPAIGGVPADMLDVFEGVSSKYGVPVDVLMGLADREGGLSKQNPAAIDATAQKLKARIDQGVSIPEAIKEYIAGPDRDSWGPQAQEFSDDVLARAKRIADSVYPAAPPAATPAPAAAPEPEQPGLLARAGEVAADAGRMAIGGVGKMTAEAIRGVGKAAQIVGDYTTTPAVNAVFGTDLRTGNVLDPVADAMAAPGERVQGGVSAETKRAIQDSTPDGDLFKPSTWTFGKDPSARGYIALGADLLGGMLPVVASSVASGGSAFVGATVGGLQGGGAAVSSAREAIDEMVRDGSIEKESAYYRELIGQGKTPEQAVQITKDAAEQFAFLLTAPVSALGGAATAKIVNPAEHILASKNIAARVAGRAALGGAEEGGQEVLESVQTNRGINDGAGTDRSLTEGTFADFVLGALGGSAVGGAAGSLSSRETPAAPQAPMPQQAHVAARPSPAPLVEPVVPTGPLSRAMQAAPVAPESPIIPVDQRVIVEDETGSYEAVVLAENDGGYLVSDGQGFQQVYSRDDLASGAVRFTPVDAAPTPPAAPESEAFAAVEQPDAEEPQEPAPPQAAAPTEPAPRPLTYAEMDEPTLRGRLKYIAEQAQRRGGWNTSLISARGLVSAEIEKRKAAALVDAAAAEAATSPTNDRPEPTQAQKEAGNYKLGHVSLGGMDISIENPAGSERKGADKSGKPWSVTMKHHYGYIRGTVGRDKDHIDVFVRPGTNELAEDAPVFVVDQVVDGKFDEHKVMVGYGSVKQAEMAYLANYTKGWKGVGGITKLTAAEFKTWLKEGDTRRAMKAQSASHAQRVADTPPTMTVKLPPQEHIDAARRVGAGRAAQAPIVTRLNDDDGNYMVATGAQLYSQNGRALAPAPKADVSTPRLRKLSITRQRQWLLDEAIKEATSRKDNWMHGMFSRKSADNLSMSDRDEISDYLFGSDAPTEANAKPGKVAAPAVAPAAQAPVAALAAALADMPPTRSTPEEIAARRAARQERPTAPGERKDAAPSRAPVATERRYADDWHEDDSEAVFDALAKLAGDEGGDAIALAVQSGTDNVDLLAAAGRAFGALRTVGGNGYVAQAQRAKVEITLDKRAGTETISLTGKRLADELRRVFPKTMAELKAEANPEAPTETARAAYGAGNKLVTADRAAELRKRLKAKLKGQLNAGIDPEVLAIGTELAAFHIEASARSFTAFAKAMASDLDTTVEKIRPYLRAWYNGARDMMEDAGHDISGTDDAETVRAQFAKLGAGDAPNAAAELDQPSPRALEAVPADAVPRVAERRETPRSAEGSGRADASRDDGLGGGRIPDARGVGDGARTVPVPARGDAVGRASGERGREGVQRADADAERPARVTPSAGTTAEQRPLDFAIADSDEIGKGGQKTKFKNNVAAIRVLKYLTASAAIASRDDQAKLAKFVGWGGLPQAFLRSDGSVSEGWEKEAKELKSLLTPEEYSAAEASTRNAHYTSPEIVSVMWDAMKHLGFTGGRVLEPSTGVGNFLGLMPPDIRSASALHGVELDPITGGIAKHLYPAAKIAAPMGFQDYTVPDGYFDAVIGNPPFGSEKLYDPKRKDLSAFSIHNYFFAKSVDALRPGGVLAMVVTNRMMDGAKDAARQYIAERAELIGAIRLPNSAFAKNAGTDVTTDIIFLRKREEGAAITGEGWAEVRRFKDAKGVEVPLNEYFERHPEMMLGEFGAHGSMYRPDDPALIARPGQDTAALLREAIGRLPAADAAPTTQATLAITSEAVSGAASVRVGSMFMDGDAVMIRDEDALGETRATAVELPSEKSRERVVGMIGLRDLFADLRGLQIDAKANDARVEAARAQLNAAYDKFVRLHGPINLDANKRLFRDDPSWPQISALEDDFDRGVSAAVSATTGEAARKPSAKKAAIFSKRTQRPFQAPTKASSAKDALVASLSERGRVDIDLMERLYGKPAETITRELGDLVYRDPTKGWVTGEEYLSGNVKTKLALAIEGAKTDASLARNVEALKAVQPADVAAIDIDVKVGSHWLPQETMVAFANFIGSGSRSKAFYNPANARWSITVDETAGARAQWGTGRAGVTEIVEAAANQRTITIRDKEGESSVVNESETQLANDKVNAVKDAWRNWVWEDDTRREQLSRLYNDMFNTDVMRRFDGSHLTFPGKISDDIITFRPHQANAIWRIIQSGTTLTDHVVGAGKTFTLIAAAMEMRRMGLARKPIFNVPNHLVGQWASDFVKLYPGANVLAATKRDFEKDRRKRLFARIATGDWDAIIVAHSSLGKVEVEPEAQAEFIDEQIVDLITSEEASRAAEGKASRNVKAIQERVTKLKERLKKLHDTGRKDDSLYWGELGVDALFVDEAHEFKNLEFSTSMQRVAGLGNQTGSQKAADLFMKVRQVLKATGGRNVTFATGTPISNTMAEMFTMQRYLDGDVLAKQGLSHFDAWARMYGEVVTDWELSPSGQYKLNSRFAKFVNMPELMQRYRTFADVITNADIKAMLAAQGKTLPIPKVAGGKPSNVVVERSRAQATFIGTPLIDKEGNETSEYPQGSLVWRAENLPKRPEKGADNMLKVMGDARKAALDMRLIDPSYPDHPGSKVNRAAQSIKGLYRKWNADLGTQLVFIDLSTPKGAKAGEAARIRELIEASEQGDDAATAELNKLSPDDLMALESSFSVYDDLKQKLVREGIPEREIAFIHDAKTDLQKQELFAKVRSGRVRVLLGSTSKMGAGTNVQERLVALHHLDAPWRPSDLEQREGRIIRQGNMLFERDPVGFEVGIYRYATKQTLDSRMWQTIEGKAKFIEQVRKGDTGERQIEDIGGEAMNAGEMKAASSGNPLILEEMALRQRIKRLDTERYGFNSDQYRLRDTIRSIKSRIKNGEALASNMEADSKVELPEEFSLTVKGRGYDNRKEAGVAIIMAAVELHASPKDTAKIGAFGGFDLMLDKAGAEQFTLTLVGEGEYETRPFTLDADPQGLATRVTNAVRGLEQDARALRESIARDKASIPDVEKNLKSWPKDDELAAAKAEYQAVLEKLKPKKAAPKTEAPAEPVKFSLAGKKPDDFVPGLDGSIDLGFIDGDNIGGRASAPIRLRVGDADRGLIHIQRDARMRDIESVGYKDGREMVAAVAAGYDSIYRGSGRSLFVVKSDARPNHAIVVRLTPDAAGNYYDVETAIVSRSDFFKNKEKLWEKEPQGRAQSNQPVSRPPSAVSGSGSKANIDGGDAEFNGFSSASAAVTHLREGDHGAQIGALIDSGRIIVHDDQSEIAGAPTGMRVQGATTPDGRVHLVAKNLDASTARAVLMHEVFHAGVQPLIGSGQWKALMKRVQTMLDMAQIKDAAGDQAGFWAAALESVNVAAAPVEHRAEELAAYAIEHREAAPAGLREVADNIIGAVKAWALRTFGTQFGNVTPGELRALALAALRSWGNQPPRGGPGKTFFSIAPRVSAKQAAATLRSYLSDTSTNALTRAMGSGLLGTVPLRPLLEELGSDVAATKRYLTVKQSMDTLRNDWHSIAHETTQRWLKYRSANRAENPVLMDLMHESTLAQVDPSEAFAAIVTPEDRKAMRDLGPGNEKYERAAKKVDQDALRKAAYPDLRQRWDALSPEAQAIYVEVRDTYKRIADESEEQVLANVSRALDAVVKKAIQAHAEELEEIADRGLRGKERIEATLAADNRLNIAKTRTKRNLAARLLRLRQAFEENRLVGPYFPLARFGNYFVTVRENGRVVSFSRFETPGQQMRFLHEMAKVPGQTAEAGALDNSAEVKGAIDPSFVADVDAILQGANASEAIRDQVWQRYLESLPDFSTRKNRIHRIGRAGFHADALRAFSSTLFHGAHQLARLKHAMELDETIKTAREQSRDITDPVKRTRTDLVLNEMEKRNAYVMSPRNAPWSQFVTSLTFGWLLGGSPAAALVNATQTVIVGLPLLASDREVGVGVSIASAELLKAAKNFVGGKGFADRSTGLTHDEHDAMKTGYGTGLIDRTQAHDIAGVAETGVEYSPTRQRIMSILAWGFHHTERANREITYLAAYRIAISKGLDHIQAIDKAMDLTWKTHFDNQSTSKPRIMQNDFGKVALTFKNFQANMLFRLFRDVHQALHGEKPEVRREAMGQLAGITGVMFLSAGIRGVWGFSLAMGLASFFLGLVGAGGDDLDEQFRKMIIENLGGTLGGMIMDGAPGYSLGISLSERIGMPDLLLRSSDRDLEGKDEFSYWVLQALGASAGALSNVHRGYSMVQDGNVWRGIETAAPTFIKNLMKAGRYATEGVNTLKGEPVVAQVPLTDVMKQLVGFTPAQVSEQYARNNFGYNLQNRIQDERSKLLGQYGRAYERNDADTLLDLEKSIDDFNSRYPAYGIGWKNIKQSMKSRSRMGDRMESGLNLNPKLKDEVESKMAPSVYR